MLVVGGGRAGIPFEYWDASNVQAWYRIVGDAPPPTAADYLTLNLDFDATAGCRREHQQGTFRKSDLRRVYFENVEWSSFTERQPWCYRGIALVVLVDRAAQLTIETGSGVRLHLDAIEQRMRETGFRYVRVTELKHGKSSRLGTVEGF